MVAKRGDDGCHHGSIVHEWQGRVMCDRVARYGDYCDAGAFSNVVPMPLHRYNRHIIDARGRINDPKHRFLVLFQLWIWILERGKSGDGRLGGV